MFIKFDLKPDKDCKIESNHTLQPSKSFKYIISNHLTLSNIQIDITLTILAIFAISFILIFLMMCHSMKKQRKISRIDPSDRREQIDGQQNTGYLISDCIK